MKGIGMGRNHARSFRGPHAATALLAVLVLSVGAAACGDDDDDTDAGTATATKEATEAGSADEVTVTAEEYSFDLSATPTADTTSITFDNQGKEFHVMIFARINDGFTVDEAVKLEGGKGSGELLAEVEAPPGKAVPVDVKGPIEPGSYALLCPIGGPDGPHYKLGQLDEFEIG
jgi:hypothetical protein